jgi:hypothetical protein
MRRSLTSLPALAAMLAAGCVSAQSSSPFTRR